MKRFAFRLQKLLDWRRQRKEAQSSVVARALAQLNREEADLHALVGQHRVTQDGLRRHRAGLLNLQQVIHTENYAKWLRQRADEHKKLVAEATSKVATERDTLTTLARDEKLLHRLRERSAEQHRKENFRSEVRELDDIANARHPGPDADPVGASQPSDHSQDPTDPENMTHG